MLNIRLTICVILFGIQILSSQELGKENTVVDNMLNAAGSMYILISSPVTSYELGMFSRGKFLQNLGIYNERCLKFRSSKEKNQEVLMALYELGVFDGLFNNVPWYEQTYDKDGTPYEYKATLIFDIFFFKDRRKQYVRVFIHEKEKAFLFMDRIGKLFVKQYQKTCMNRLKSELNN